ncbi:hypothetical protein CHU92_06000, partial [Flavobacterium cyanobacteriorum]
LLIFNQLCFLSCTKNSLIKDLYFLGLVLNRKYMLLRITYTVFMIGIVVSVASFIIALKMINVPVL